MQTTQTEQQIYTVSELNLAVRAVLDEAFDCLWIKGEISNFASPRSGHWYFTLKDDTAQVRCAMFRGNNRLVNFQPKDGLEIHVYAKAGLYPERGDFQLILERMEISGEGALRQAFEALKAKLLMEGLFEEAKKKPIPEFPMRLGVITSSTGAAIRDILSVLKRRFPLLEVYIYSTMVQGQGATQSIVDALNFANQYAQTDVLILARGGGSLEDLWCFNEESVARAIFKSKIPIVTGVGHETDFTIADFVADKRAPTPSAAAETISPDGDALLSTLEDYEAQLTRIMLRILAYHSQKLDHLEQRLPHPLKTLKLQARFLKDMIKRLNLTTLTSLKHQKQHLMYQVQTLNKISPLQKIEHQKRQVEYLTATQSQSMNGLQLAKGAQFKEIVRALELVSPLATLARGYSITFVDDNSVLKSIKQVKKGDCLKTKFLDGEVESVVKSCDSQ